MLKVLHVPSLPSHLSSSSITDSHYRRTPTRSWIVLRRRPDLHRTQPIASILLVLWNASPLIWCENVEYCALRADCLQVHSGWMKRDLESDTCALADKYISEERVFFPPITLALMSRIDGTAGEKLESWLSRLCIQGLFITCVVLFRNSIRLISLGTVFLALSLFPGMLLSDSVTEARPVSARQSL